MVSEPSPLMKQLIELLQIAIFGVKWDRPTHMEDNSAGLKNFEALPSWREDLFKDIMALTDCKIAQALELMDSKLADHVFKKDDPMPSNDLESHEDLIKDIMALTDCKIAKAQEIMDSKLADHVFKKDDPIPANELSLRDSQIKCDIMRETRDLINNMTSALTVDLKELVGGVKSDELNNAMASFKKITHTLYDHIQAGNRELNRRIELLEASVERSVCDSLSLPEFHAE